MDFVLLLPKMVKLNQKFVEHSNKGKLFANYPLCILYYKRGILELD